MTNNVTHLVISFTLSRYPTNVVPFVGNPQLCPSTPRVTGIFKRWRPFIYPLRSRLGLPGGDITEMKLVRIRVPKLHSPEVLLAKSGHFFLWHNHTRSAVDRSVALVRPTIYFSFANSRGGELVARACSLGFMF